MPRQARVDIAGEHYVTNRGSDGAKIFGTDAAKREFLAIVCRSCERYGAAVGAYVISDTAYHMIVKTSSANLSLLMRQISAAYAIYYNKARENRGTIWHDRFSSWVISDKKELLLLYRYLGFLPVIEKFDKNPFEYQYSFITTIFSDNQTLPCQELLLKRKKIASIRKGKFGDEDVAALKAFKKRAREVAPQERKKEKQEPLEAILKKIKTTEKRNKKIRKAFAAGYTQNEIALFLNLSQSSISKIVNASGEA